MTVHITSGCTKRPPVTSNIVIEKTISAQNPLPGINDEKISHTLSGEEVYK